MNTSSNFIRRISTVIFSALSLLMFNGIWLKFNTSYLLGSSTYGYTLFDITDFFDKMNRTFGGGGLEIYTVIFAVLSYLSVILLIVGIVFSVIRNTKNTFANLGATFSIILAIVFYLVVFGVNEAVREEIYGGAPNVLTTTYRPFLLIIFSVIICFSSGEQKFQKQQNDITYNFCMSCGSRLPVNATFCPSCGAVVNSDDKLAALAKDREIKTNVERTLRNGGWRCDKCNRINPSYTGTCACGNSKYDQ